MFFYFQQRKRIFMHGITLNDTKKYLSTKILFFSDWIRLYKMSSGHAILAPTDQDIRQMIAAKVI